MSTSERGKRLKAKAAELREIEWQRKGGAGKEKQATAVSNAALAARLRKKYGSGRKSTASAAWPPTKWPIAQALSGDKTQALAGVDDFVSPLLETVSNIPSSGLKYADDITYPIRHPIDTAEGLGNLASGLLHKTPFYPGEQADEAYPDAVGEHFSNRYGGLDELGNTIKTDPVGFVGDAAGIFSALGAIPKLSKLGQVGRTIEPANLAIKGASKLTGMGEALPRHLYGRAGKFSTKIPINRRNEILQQLVDDGVTFTEKGVNKNLRNIAEDERALQSSVNKAMNPPGQPPHPGVDAALTFGKAEDYVGAMRPTVSSNMATSPAEVNAANRTLNFLKKWREASGKPVMNLSDVLENKRQHYDRIDWRKGKKRKVVNEIHRKIAQADKEILEANVPGIKERNEQFGRRLEGKKSLEQATERIGNAQLLSLSNILSTSAGGLMAGATTGSPTHMLSGLLGGYLVSQLNSPRFATGLARTLNTVGNNKVARDFRARPWESKLMPEGLMNSPRKMSDLVDLLDSQAVAQGLLQTGRNTKSSEEVKAKKNTRRGRNKR